MNTVKVRQGEQPSIMHIGILKLPTYYYVGSFKSFIFFFLATKDNHQGCSHCDQLGNTNFHKVICKKGTLHQLSGQLHSMQGVLLTAILSFFLVQDGYKQLEASFANQVMIQKYSEQESS